MINYDLIHHPFNVINPEKSMIKKTSDGFELYFDNNIFSKKIYSNLNTSIKNYIEIEIFENGDCKMISETNELHEFTTPADFFIEKNFKTKKFYSEVYKNIITENNLENLEKYALEFDNFCKNEFIPEYPVPITTISSHFENFNMNNIKNFENNSYSSIQIKFEDEIPKEYPKEIKNQILKEIGNEKYYLQEKIFNNFFKKNKIVKIKEIENLYYKILNEEEKKMITYTFFKKAIILHAYLYINGPWRHCWVAMGYNPTMNQKNYKYQTLYKKGTHIPYQLIEYPEIIKEVEKKPDWFLLKKCHSSHGFISKALQDFILFAIKK